MEARASSSSVWAEAFRVERAGIDLRVGVAGAVATSGPLALGLALGEPAIGVVGCFGGLHGALGVPRGARRTRIGWGVLAALLCCVSLALATAVQPSVAASAVAVFVVVALATALRAFGRDGGLTGFLIGAIFTIGVGIPAAGLDVAERTGWYALGSLLGIVLMVLARGGPRAAPPTPLAAVLADGLRRLAATFRHDRALRGHALRLAGVVAATTLAYLLLELEHGYWIPLSVLAVLQPDEHDSRVRAVQRACGTLVGTFVIALLTIATGAEWLMAAAQALCAFGLFTLYARGYFWLVVLLTPTALLTISAVDYQGAGIALERVGWSAAGIVAGLAIGELANRLSAAPWRSRS